MPARTIQPSFAAGVIGPGLQGRVDLGKYDVALKLGVNIFIHPYGGASNTPGWEFVGEVPDSTDEWRLIPFERDDENNYALMFGETEMGVVSDGAIVQNATPATITGITQANPAAVVATNTFANDDLVTITDVVGMTELNGRTFIAKNVTASGFNLYDRFGNFVDATGYTAYTSGGEATVPYTITSPYTADQAQNVDHAQSADVMFFAHQEVTNRKLIHLGATNWSFDTVDVDPTNAAPTGVTLSASTGSENYRYVVTSVDANGVESFQSSAVQDTTAHDIFIAGNSLTLSWTAAPGAVEYNVYRQRNAIYGFIGFTSNNSFNDDGIDSDLDINPPVASGLFGAAGDYPAAVDLIQQRLAYGGSINEPETVWMSRTANFENFTKSRILAPADRIEVGLSGRSINSVRQLLGLRELIVFAARGEFTINGADDFLSAVEPVVIQHGYTGAKAVKPLVVNDTALFVEPSGQVVRDLRYAFEQDGYTGNELSILAYHFFRNKAVKQWAYSQAPDSIVWTVMTDGSLLSMTYKREHQVWAWTEHDLGEGVTVESVTSILEDRRNAVYIIAKKTVMGQEKRYVLRLHEREFTDVKDGFFVDFGLSYNGTPVTTVSGMEHLRGETVVALADGNVIDNLLVDERGRVTLETAASTIHVGTYTPAEMETLPMVLDLAEYGASLGRPQKANRVALQVENTRGIRVGPGPDNLTDWVQVVGPDLSDDIPMATGFFSFTLGPEWNNDGTIYIRQDFPLPMTILAVAPDRTVGR